MLTIVDISLPGDAFVLGQLLSENPEIHVEIERFVPLGDRLLPFFWVSNESADDIEAELEAQPVVESVERLTTVDDRHLYQVTWTPEVNGITDALTATEGVILEGKGLAGQWELRLQFPDHDALHEFNESCNEKDISIAVKGIYNPHTPAIEDRLTQVQWQTLVTAYELGYFEVPRSATLSDLATHFDVSEQAISQRLRRAMNAVVDGLIFDS